MEKVVLTGATGLIGKELIEPLKEFGFEVHCLTSKNCNLFDFNLVDNFFTEIKPQYLLHFAWITGGDYLSNPINNDYVEASMNMLKSFAKNGGKRAVFAGTCFEYEFKDSPLRETDVLNPKSLYAQCKVKLCKDAIHFCDDNNISFGWGRIFYVYGKNEKEGRLTQSIVSKLRNNEKVIVKFGQLNRDYMYTKDIAAAFVKFLKTDVEGCVNICTGKGITLGAYAKKIADKMGKQSLLDVREEPTEQPINIIGDNARLLNEVKFNCNFSYEKAMDDLIPSYK